MKLLNKFFIPLMAAGVLASCSSEAVDGPTIPVGSEITDPCILQVEMSLPTVSGTRATNVGNPDTEVGFDAENKIKSAIIVLADPTDNGFIDWAELKIGEGSSAAHTATFSRSTLATYINSINSGENKVNVYVFANHDAVDETLVTELKKLEKNSHDKNWYNVMTTLSQNANTSGEWNGRIAAKMPMSNAEIYTATLPTADNLKLYTETNPWHLSGGQSNPGKIKLERSVSRFDFRDGSPEGNYTYTIYDFNGDGVPDELKEDTQIKVILEYIGLVNMSNKYYMLRHMADSKADSKGAIADTDKVSLLTTETENNWVIDADATSKTDGADSFIFPVLNADKNPNRNNWYATEISSLKTPDNWNGTNEYFVWRYVTENTISSIDGQKNGVSTGVVFKARLDVVTNETDATKFGPRLRASMGKTGGTPKTLFFFGDKNYPVGDADYIMSMDDNAPEKVAYLASFENGEFKAELATKNGFTLYEPVTEQNKLDNDKAGEYYMYYYYWNRHRDNGNDGEMGIMEFGTVRNYIYKLAVLEINTLGHPRISKNDPDPIDPGTPDENDKLAIKVVTEVKNWGVRENGIKF